MKHLQAFRLGLAGCILTMTGWICAPLQAQQPAPNPDAAVADQILPKGPLPLEVAKKVRAIVLKQVLASVPKSDDEGVEIIRFEPDKDPALKSVSDDGQTYSSRVFRSFLAEPASAGEFDSKEYYVKTTGDWKIKLKNGWAVIPADTYLTGMADGVTAYDHDMIEAQDKAIAQSAELCKDSMAKVEPARKDAAEKVAALHKDDMDALSKQITQLKADIDQKQKARDAARQQVARRPPAAPATAQTGPKDANGNVTWQWSPSQGFTFNDTLEQSKQSLDQALAQQKTLKAQMDEEMRKAMGPPGAIESTLRTVLRKQTRRILAGEMISPEDMRAEYDAVLAAALKAASDAGTTPPTDVKPPIRATPAPKPRP